MDGSVWGLSYGPFSKIGPSFPECLPWELGTQW